MTYRIVLALAVTALGLVSLVTPSVEAAQSTALGLLSSQPSQLTMPAQSHLTPRRRLRRNSCLKQFQWCQAQCEKRNRRNPSAWNECFAICYTDYEWCGICGGIPC